MALIDKASLLMVPSTYEAGTLYNVLPSGNRAPDSTGENSGYDQTRADFTFDRGSNAAATRVNSDGLIEKYRENLLTYSNDFSRWTNSATTEASGFEGYDGTNDAWEIEKTSASAYSSINKTLTATSGVVTISAYVKKGTLSVTSLYASGGTNPYILFSFDSATITAQRPGLIDTNVEDKGNGWYRISLTTTESIAQITLHPDWAGTNTGTIYAQDVQVESGLVATDYLDSGATTAKAGVLIDLPRINYDANGENGALLLEPQRANLFVISEYIGDYNFLANNILSKNDDVLSPEGVYNGWKCSRNVNSAGYIFNTTASIAPSTTYTYSVFVKANDLNICDALSIQLHPNSFVPKTTLFDFETGTASGDGVVESFGNGWYRVSITSTTLGSIGYFKFGIQPYLNGSTTIGGSDGDVLYYSYGNQVEAGSYPTSYIPTYGTSQTRSADSCSVTGVSDVIGQTEGTIYAEVNLEELSAENRFILTISNSSQSIAIFLRHRSSNQLQFYSAGLTNNFDIRHSITNGGTFKIAGAYKSGDIAFYIDGTQIGTDSSTFSTPSLTDARLGTQVSTGFELGGGIKESILFNERLSNAELATLTTL